MSLTQSRTLDPVRQFSVFLESKVGLLSELIAVLDTHAVHVVALTVLDATDSAIVRLIVDDPDRARRHLHDQGFHATEIALVAVELAAQADLRRILAAVLAAEVNIHYAYAFTYRPEGKHALALSVDDAEVTVAALGGAGFRVLGQNDIAR